MGAPSPAKKKSTIDDVLKKAKPAERTVEICVAGDVSGEHERLVAELETAGRDALVSDSRLGSGQAATDGQLELARRIQELEGQMAEATYTFRFRAISSKAWSDLLAAHPDKKKERLFDPDSFVPASIAACCIEPEGMDDPEQAAKLFDALSAGQQGELFEAAWEVNQGGPKGQISSLASAVLAVSEKSSATASSTESPAASS